MPETLFLVRWSCRGLSAQLISIRRVCRSASLYARHNPSARTVRKTASPRLRAGRSRCGGSTEADQVRRDARRHRRTAKQCLQPLLPGGVGTRPDTSRDNGLPLNSGSALSIQLWSSCYCIAWSLTRHIEDRARSLYPLGDARLIHSSRSREGKTRFRVSNHLVLNKQSPGYDMNVSTSDGFLVSSQGGHHRLRR